MIPTFSAGLLTFCEGAKSILLGPGRGLPLDSPKVLQTMGVLVKASVNATGISPTDLIDAYERSDYSLLKERFVEALSPFMERSPNERFLWALIKPEEKLLNHHLFKENVVGVVKSGRAVASYYPYLSYQNRVEEDTPWDTDLLNFISTSRPFFEGASRYALHRGAFEIAERLLWWGVVAAEFKGQPVPETSFISLNDAYRYTGRCVSAERMESLYVLKTNPQRKDDWKEKIEFLRGNALKVLSRFLSMEGTSASRETSYKTLKQQAHFLVEEMSRDAVVRPLVAMPSIVLVPRKGDSAVSLVSRKGFLSDHGGFFFDSRHYHVLKPFNEYFKSITKDLRQETLIVEEEEIVKNWPKPLTDLIDPYRELVSILCVLEMHQRDFNQAVIEHDNPPFDVLKNWVNRALSMDEDSRNDAVDLDADGFIRLRQSLLMLELADYWLEHYLRGTRIPLHQEMETVKNSIKPLYTKTMRRFYEQVRKQILSPRTNLTFRVEDLVLYKNDFKSQFSWGAHIADLKKGDCQGVLTAMKECEAEKVRDFIRQVIQRRSEIYAAWKEKGLAIDYLISFCDELWTLSPEIVDIALWACQLDESREHVVESYSRLIKISKIAWPSAALGLWINRLAPRAIYE